MSIPEDERNLQYKFLSFYVRINDKELEGNKSSRFALLITYHLLQIGNDMADEFVWKAPKDIWKGVGIYHITFVVSGRKRLLGELVALADSRAYSRSVQRFNDTDVNTSRHDKAPKYTSELATTELSAFGFAVHDHLMELEKRFEDPLNPPASNDDKAFQICGKQFMPDHLHVVVWVKKDLGQSIRQIAHGFRIGIRMIAEDMGVWKREDGHVFEKPFIRTLSRKGQKRKMIDYVHANPDNAWMRRLHPDMYVIRRNMEYAGLHFDCMGKARLLDYPDRNVVALSRSLTDDEIAAEVQKALRKAERGVVTYCAAMNKGEQKVTKAIREAGYPLVVMMLDGFPAPGTEAERFYKPGGVYHKTCGEGRLYLMAPLAENYNNPRLIERTEAELKRKAEEKGKRYYGIPHESTRWRMIAGNVMLEMIAED